MTTLNKGAADTVRRKAQEASEKTTKSVMDLAAALWDTFHNDVTVGGQSVQLWEAWGFESWFDYAERELGIHQTTAAAYRRIHEVFEVELKDAWDKGLTASYTKMKSLCRVVTRTSANAWLRKAAKLSCCELEEEVTLALYGKTRGGAVHSFLANVTKTELAKINQVLSEAREASDEPERRGKVLTRILEEWQTIHQRAKRVRRAA
jgi:hypothetical protein